MLSIAPYRYTAMTQPSKPASPTTANPPSPATHRVDHNAEWDADDGNEPPHGVLPVQDRGLLDSLGRAVSETVRPAADKTPDDPA